MGGSLVRRGGPFSFQGVDEEVGKNQPRKNAKIVLGQLEGGVRVKNGTIVGGGEGKKSWFGGGLRGAPPGIRGGCAIMEIRKGKYGGYKKKT